MDCSTPGSSLHGSSQARVLEWVAMSFARGIFWTQGQTPALAGGFFITEPPENLKVLRDDLKYILGLLLHHSD